MLSKIFSSLGMPPARSPCDRIAAEGWRYQV